MGWKDACFKCGARKPRDHENGDIDGGANAYLTRDRETTTERPRERKICHQYQDTGSCSFGADCKFSHVEDEPAKESKSKTKPRDKKTLICHQYQETGTCKFGDECKFSHNEDLADDVVGNPVDDSEQICRLFQKKGSCKFGDA